MTVLGKSGDAVEARVDGIAVARLETPAEDAETHRIPAPPYSDGTRACGFELETPGYAGTTTDRLHAEVGDIRGWDVASARS